MEKPLAKLLASAGLAPPPVEGLMATGVTNDSGAVANCNTPGALAQALAVLE